MFPDRDAYFPHTPHPASSAKTARKGEGAALCFQQLGRILQRKVWNREPAGRRRAAKAFEKMRLGIRKGCPAFCTQEVGAGAPQQRQSRRYGGSLLQGGGLVLKALFAQGELWRAFFRCIPINPYLVSGSLYNAIVNTTFSKPCILAASARQFLIIHFRTTGIFRQWVWAYLCRRSKQGRWRYQYNRITFHEEINCLTYLRFVSLFFHNRILIWVQQVPLSVRDHFGVWYADCFHLHQRPDGLH